MKNIKIMLGVLVLSFAVIWTSCTSLLDTNFSSEAPADESIGNLEEALIALNGVYDNMQNRYMYGQCIYTFGDARSGDMQPTSSGDSRTDPIYVFNNKTSSNSTMAAEMWYRLYIGINRANQIIAKFEDDTLSTVDEDGTVNTDGESILGQCIALRALFHHEVCKHFAVPYLKPTTDTKWGAVIVDQAADYFDKPLRSTLEESYDFIISELIKALDLLESTKPETEGDIRNNYGYMNYWAAKSLLARVYLYKGDYANALTYAEDVINNSPYSLIEAEDYVASWTDQANSFTTESIFSVINTSTDNITRECLASVSQPENYGEIIVSTSLLELLESEAGDVRLDLIGEDKTGQLGWCMKYPGTSSSPFENNTPVVRLSEVYLIAAEAALKAGSNQSKANQYLNDLRKNRFILASSYQDIIVATEANIRNERRRELMHEGHRFNDIMRTGESVTREGGRNYLNEDGIPTINWDVNYCVLPIPSAEIDGNPDIQQNPGYNQ